MKLAAYRHQGQPGVGRVSADGRSVEPFLQVDAALGVLPLVEALAAGRALPATGPAIALDQVQLGAPIPRPRRNIFCV
ncbi:MAG: hydrolase, partial [Ramlibacter sp.]